MSLLCSCDNLTCSAIATCVLPVCLFHTVKLPLPVSRLDLCQFWDWAMLPWTALASYYSPQRDLNPQTLHLMPWNSSRTVQCSKWMSLAGGAQHRSSSQKAFVAPRTGDAVPWNKFAACILTSSPQEVQSRVVTCIVETALICCLF